MITDNKAKEIVHFCYKVLFLLADPPVNFDKLLKQNKKKEFPDGWFRAYILHEDATLNVIKRVGKIYSLKKREKESLKTTILLGCSPTYPKEK